MEKPSTQKSKTKSLLTGILILTVGVLLIICNKLITSNYFVVLAGILFVLTGVINLVVYVNKKDDNGVRENKGMSLALGWMVSVSAIILGICMLSFSSTFNAMIPFIFGLLIFFGAVMLSIMMLVNARKYIKVPLWLWIFPLAMIILGIVTITRKAVVDDSLIMIMTGVSMILFGFTGIVLGAMIAGAKQNMVMTSARKDTPKIETHDVEAKEVK